MRRPFDEDRLAGFVYRVDATAVETTLPYARQRPSALHGERLARGEVGEFVIIDVGNRGVLGRLTSVWVPTRDRDSVDSWGETGRAVSAVGQVQLIATVRMDGTSARGVEQPPAIGNPVYSAAVDVVEAVLNPGEFALRGPQFEMGVLASQPDVTIGLAPGRLIGRHLAVVGSTGSGKSWTVAHILEEIRRLGGKAVLIDATGEFHTLGDYATHVAIGGPLDPTDGSAAAALPHSEISETDLHVFLRPSPGTQLPRLREAVRSLRLASILGADHDLVDEYGCIPKRKRERRPFFAAFRQNVAALEAPFGDFDLRALPRQIQYECVWETDLQNESYFGDYMTNDIAYCASLIARTRDILHSPETMAVLQPDDARPSVVKALDAFIDDADSRILRLSLRELPFARHLREIVVNAIGRALLDRARSGRFLETPVLVSIDEAHQFFGRTIGDELVSAHLDHFESIAKEGRKYGLTLCMATQRPGDLPSGVMSQAGMLLVHRLGDGRDRERIEHASSDLDKAAVEQLPTLVPGEALFVGVDFPVPSAVRLNPPLRPPASEGPRYDEGWARLEEPN